MSEDTAEKPKLTFKIHKLIYSTEEYGDELGERIQSAYETAASFADFINMVEFYTGLIAFRESITPKWEGSYMFFESPSGVHISFGPPLMPSIADCSFVYFYEKGTDLSEIGFPPQAWHDKLKIVIERNQ